MLRLLVPTLLTVLAVTGSASAAWTAPVDVPGSRGGVLSRVALAQDGTIAVAWGAAKAAVRLPAGRWVPARRMNPRRTTATLPDAAFDSRGRLLVVWTQSPARPGRPLEGPYEIRLRRWTARGGWGPAQVLGRSLHFILAQPRVAANGRGDAIVSWRGFRHAGRRLPEALASRLSIDGGRFGPERTAAAGGPYRDVALDPGGNAYGVYTTYAGPRNFFVFQRRGHGWGRPVALPDRPASKPRIAVGADRTAVIAWRGAEVDSEGSGIQAGPPSAIMRGAGGGFTFPFRLSSSPVTDVAVVAQPGSNHLLTWAASEFTEPAPPGTFDLRYAVREEGNALGMETTVPGARMGPSAFLAHGDALVVYRGDDFAIRSVRRSLRAATFGVPETIAARGLLPALAAAGDRAAATWFDTDRNRLRLARLRP